MTTTDFFFALSAIYLAPHADKKTGTIIGVSFCVAAIFCKFADA